MKKKSDLKPFGDYLEIISHSHDRYKVFDDFLTIIVCTLSLGRKEELYKSTIKPYTKEEIDLFCSAYASLINQMDRNQFNDPVGDYFGEHLSNAQNGQFFTPQYVSDLMAVLANVPKAGKDTGNEKDKRVYDPACGSGRLLLSSAKLNRERYFVGADISYTCCLMTLINMCLNSLRGEVYHMNSLSNTVWHRWLIMIDEFSKLPFIYEVEEEKETTPKPAAVLIEEREEKKEVKIKPLEAFDNNGIGFVTFTAKA